MQILHNYSLKIMQIFPFACFCKCYLSGSLSLLPLYDKAWESTDLKKSVFPEERKGQVKQGGLSYFQAVGVPSIYTALQPFSYLNSWEQKIGHEVWPWTTLIFYSITTKEYKKCFHYWKRFDSTKLLNIKTKQTLQSEQGVSTNSAHKNLWMGWRGTF